MQAIDLIRAAGGVPWRRRVRLQASAAKAPTSLQAACGEPVQFELQAADGGSQRIKSFSMTVYTGGAMFPSGWPYSEPVVVDLEGMDVPRQSVPADLEHRTLVGHTESIELTKQRLKASGKISGFDAEETTAIALASRELTRLAANGFPWQASMEAEITRLEFVDKGASVNVNGKNFDGPVYVARATSLRRVSFVPNGADAGTSASIAAGANQQGKTMNEFDTFVTDLGLDPTKITDGQRVKLQAAFKAQQTPTPTPPNPTPPPPNPTPEPEPKPPSLKAARDEAATESRRVAEIRRLCAKHGGLTMEVENADGTKRQDVIEAHAIENGWTPKETAREVELAVLRAARPTPDEGQGPFGYVASGKPNVTAEILECSLARTRGLPDVEKRYTPQVLEAADKHYRGYGIAQVMLVAAAANGYPLRPGAKINSGNISEVLRYAFPPIRAGFSTMNLPGILGNVANAEIMAGYMQEMAQWREISQIKSASNFFGIPTYRLLDNFEYEELGPTAEIKHGSLGEESFTRQVRTFAKMFVLTREAIINDEIGAFDDLKVRLGRGSARKLNRVFWTTFLANSTFFTAARGNYTTGATTTLLTDGVGLQLGVADFYDLTSPGVNGESGERFGGEPKILLVPPSLQFSALRLMAPIDPATTATTNIFAGRFRVIVVPQLEDPSYANSSSTAWYLLRDPQDRAAMVVSFLDGKQTPTVESTDADFNTLGVQYRGYHDFGATLADPYAGTKIKGSA